MKINRGWCWPGLASSQGVALSAHPSPWTLIKPPAGWLDLVVTLRLETIPRNLDWGNQANGGLHD